MPMLLVRPLLFSVLFFFFLWLVSILVRHFLPELLEGGGKDADLEIFPGSRVDISEDDTQSYNPDYSQGQFQDSAQDTAQTSLPAFMNDQSGDYEDTLGDISGLAHKGVVSTNEGKRTPMGMDHEGQNDYTEGGVLEGLPEQGKDYGATPSVSAGGSKTHARKAAGKWSGEAEELNSGDMLMDLDSVAGAFSSISSDEETDSVERSVSAPNRKPLSTEKSPSWAGDFNAKDMAKGLQTVLKKDKEG
jgi:hypothetical protein